MKSEEKLNEALRAALKRKFDDFEEKPNPASFNIIRAHIKQPRNYKYLFLSLLLIGVTVTGFLINQHWGEMPEVKIVPQKAIKAIPAVEVEKEIAAKEIENPNLPRQVSVDPNKTNRQTGAVGKLSKQVTIAKNQEKQYQLTEKKLPRQVLADDININLPKQANRSLPQQVLKPEDGKLEIKEKTPEPELAPTLALQLSKLESQQMKSDVMNLPGVTVPGKDSPYYKHINSSKISWLVNAAVLNSYQILTVPKASGQDFQNFKFPSAFSLESVGYKFSVGLEKKGFQALLHYSTYRQKYSYEIAGNEYIVQDKGQNYTIERPGTVVTENNKMDLLGIGLNKQIVWGHSPFQKYYASAGLEYSRTLHSKTSIGWVSASLGKQFAVGRTALLHVGPYAEFSPIKISGADNPFLYQPYRVGISVGMKLIRP